MSESERLDHEYYPVILDIGSMFLKAGIGGDPFPNAIERTNFQLYNYHENVQFPPYFDFNNPLLTKQQQNTLRNKELENKDSKKLCQIFTKDTNLWIPINTQTISKNDELKLIGKINSMLCNKLIISPKKLKVILIDTNLSMVNKFKLLNILLNKVQIKSVFVIPEPILTVLGSNLTNGVVLNFNWELFTLHLIADLRIIDRKTKEIFHNYNGLTLHYKIIEKLIDLNTLDSNKLLESDNLFEIIEKFVTSAVFVRAIDDTNIYDQEFEIANNIIIPNKLRYEVIEECFFSNDALSSLVILTIKQTEIDLRKILLENIIFSGGLSNIPGFKTRLIQELEKKVGVDKVKGKISLGSWTGCSLYISTSLRKYSKEWKKQEIDIKVFNNLRVDNSDAAKLSALPDNINLYYRSKFHSNKS